MFRILIALLVIATFLPVQNGHARVVEGFHNELALAAHSSQGESGQRQSPNCPAPAFGACHQSNARTATAESVALLVDVKDPAPALAWASERIPHSALLDRDPPVPRFPL